MKRILILTIFLLFSLCNTSFATTRTNLLDADLITVKTELDNLHYKAESNGKLSASDMNKLSQIRQKADTHKSEDNTNIEPIYFKLGNIYKALGMKDDAIFCYRVIVKKYPYTPMGKKSLVNLKYYGETQTDNYGRTTAKPWED